MRYAMFPVVFVLMLVVLVSLLASVTQAYKCPERHICSEKTVVSVLKLPAENSRPPLVTAEDIEHWKMLRMGTCRGVPGTPYKFCSDCYFRDARTDYRIIHVMDALHYMYSDNPSLAMMGQLWINMYGVSGVECNG